MGHKTTSDAQVMFAKKIKYDNTLIWGVPRVVCLKWKCMGTPTIFKRDYPIDNVAVDVNGRRNRQCNTIIIVKLKKAKERTAAAEVNVGQINIFGTFSQGSSNPSMDKWVSPWSVSRLYFCGGSCRMYRTFQN
jgi:hypothetical protein